VAEPLGWDVCQSLTETNDAVEQALRKIEALDFTMLKRKLVESAAGSKSSGSNHRIFCRLLLNSSSFGNPS
jgi:hypothetical protein